jgi:hypothetical protein
MDIRSPLLLHQSLINGLKPMSEELGFPLHNVCLFVGFAVLAMLIVVRHAVVSGWQCNCVGCCKGII